MWHYVLCLVLVGLSDANVDRRTNKYVTTQISAKWSETPIVLEVAEYLGDEDPNYFWRFVEAVVSTRDDVLITGTHICFCLFGYLYRINKNKEVTIKVRRSRNERYFSKNFIQTFQEQTRSATIEP